MFKLSSRRYTGAKTKLLSHIDSVFLRHLSALQDIQNLSFFDVFAGTGVVSEFFMRHYGTDFNVADLQSNDKKADKKPRFTHFILNDFLHSNYAIYKGFFGGKSFDNAKLGRIAKSYNALNVAKIPANYYTHSFGNLFFSEVDSSIIGHIRDDLDALLDAGKITQREFYILLCSLIYSADRVANTVGHYDAYRKNIPLQDRFSFGLIKPLDMANVDCEIFRADSNVLVRDFVAQNRQIDIAFIDPPYNSRQYARFYHLLETLAKNDKPKLYGVARKPEPENVSEYCKSNAKEAFADLVANLTQCTKILLVTYNNTYSSKSSSSQNKISLEQITQILQSHGTTHKYEFDFKAFTSGKTEFSNHKEMIFVCEVAHNFCA
ncbi:DNA adenine methylase [Helicobacter sp. T3_23-1059]